MVLNLTFIKVPLEITKEGIKFEYMHGKAKGKEGFENTNSIFVAISQNPS